MKTIAFTGHRPSKLGGYNWNTPKNQEIIRELSYRIMEILDSNDKNGEETFHFICGGALGIDQMAFEICEKLKYTYVNTITTEIALPFLNQDIKWNDFDRLRWENHLKVADVVTKVDKLSQYKIEGYEEDIYYPAKMQKRNEYMVNNADIVIAVWDGTAGGTGNCVKYARKLKREIIQIDPNEISL